ncbi:MAG: hypothetical protein JWM19_4190 [Actinomycetia bacterium]|nr:hypothetical protein [Actinomycetes bacterium]
MTAAVPRSRAVHLVGVPAVSAGRARRAAHHLRISAQVISQVIEPVIDRA